MNRQKRFQFFLKNAGYCTPPGRATCALQLAKAEEEKENKIESGEWKFEWQQDEDYDDFSWDEDGWFRQKLEEGTGMVCCLILYKKCSSCGNYEIIDSLGGITMIIGDEEKDARLFEANMALENLD